MMVSSTSRLYLVRRQWRRLIQITGSILRFDQHSSKMTTLVRGQKMPDGIDICESAGRMFWANMGRSLAACDGSVHSAKLDGSDMTTVLPSGAVHTPMQLAGGRWYDATHPLLWLWSVWAPIGWALMVRTMRFLCEPDDRSPFIPTNIRAGALKSRPILHVGISDHTKRSVKKWPRASFPRTPRSTSHLDGRRMTEWYRIYFKQTCWAGWPGPRSWKAGFLLDRQRRASLRLLLQSTLSERRECYWRTFACRFAA